MISDGGSEGEEEKALGHSSVICSLLKLCRDDERVEESLDLELDMDPKRFQAAKDRIRSEYESYPATLANVISDGPCYQDVLKACAARKSLVLHIVGAAENAELWDAVKGANIDDVVTAYAEALSELAGSRGFDVIQLIFIGPDCPEQSLQLTKPMRLVTRDRPVGDLHVRTYRSIYNRDVLEHNAIPKPDIVVYFNPGFTVAEYSWNDTLASIETGTPFLSTTNTELEGIADCQYLLDQDKIQSLPPGLAEIFGFYSPGDDEDGSHFGTSFFSENPFSPSRVRQSGTMANDVFIKNRWMLGGIVDSFDPSKATGDMPSKKLRTSAETNSKAGNPALI